MKIAEVKYTGSLTSQQFQGPSGQEYLFRNPMGGTPRPVAVEDIDDANRLEDIGTYEVDWTGVGKVLRAGEGPINSVADMGYKQKQKIAKQFNIKANQSQEDLDDELQPVVEDLAHQLENEL